jgi:hypothetical protein
MKHGNWIPLSKSLTKELPLNRPYSKVEAAFALQVDFDNERAVSIAGYAKQWNWGRKKVINFFNELGITINYATNTAIQQNQKGQIGVQIRDRSGADKDQISFINNKDLSTKRSRSGTDREQMRDRPRDTTIDTKTDTHTETKNVRVFSDSFMKEHWERWTRLKKGGPYRSPEIESIALEELHALSLGDEAIAANGLRAAIAAQAQSFSWCFKSLDNRQPQSHERSVHHTGRPSESDERFGADNIRWLELHARPSGP